MNKIHKSPDRNSFQKEGYIQRAEEKGEELNQDYIEMFNTYNQQDEINMTEPSWQENNMEYTLRSTKWICDKVKACEVYAQNLYAAMCNIQFQELEVMPILKDQKWSCSWRHAGGIIADMQEKGDYINWYCSGIRGETLADAEFGNLTLDEQESYKATQAFVSEGIVTNEVAEDLKKLGWQPMEWKD